MRLKGYAVLILMAMLLSSCAMLRTIQQKWEQLTPDEKARVIISDMQGQVRNMFELGKAYVEANPDKRAIWQKQVLPAIEAANRALGQMIAAGATGPLTPEKIYHHCQALVDISVDAMRKMGVKI